MGGFTHFGHPAWLVAAVAAALALPLLYGAFDRGQRRRAAAFSLIRPAAVPAWRAWLKRALFTAAVACVCVALAAPQGALQLTSTEQRGIDFLFAIDT
ncbi:MAG TPA: hypothetical protein VMB48_01150, partial [Steroidobacteraceae bacterium]|nr:hypothetical protein [Steroidobacteraceae bacterium]